MPRPGYAGPRLPSDLLVQVGAPGPQQQQQRQRQRKYDHRRFSGGRGGRDAQAPKRGQDRRVRGNGARQATRDDAGSDASPFPDDEDEDSDHESGLKYTTTSERKRKHADDGLPAAAPAPRKKARKELEDEAEIAALEKKLGIKDSARKLPKAFEDDGLGEILGGLDGDFEEEDEDAKRDRAWLERKKAGKSARDLHEDSESVEDDDDSEDGDEEDEQTQKAPAKRVRENPYVAPVAAGQKYVPPARQAPSSADAEADARIKRQVKGQVNRLSEANILTILGELERLLANNPRNAITSALVEHIVDLTSDATVLGDSFLIVHAGLVAAVYKVVGSEFGAQFLSSFVARMSELYDPAVAQEAQEGSGHKGVVNLVSLLAQLYNLQVVSSTIVFDYVRMFLHSITEDHTELLLRVVRCSGAQLRQDDPTALKDIASTLQRKIREVGEAAVSVRTRFMLETIVSLKDNKLKQGAAGSALMGEQLSRMRKSLGALSSRNLRATEPLSIGLKDIQEGDKRGKWWLVGASWKDAATAASTAASQKDSMHAPEKAAPEEMEVDDTAEKVDLLALARANHMTTPLRQRIFVALVSATDCRNAHVQLSKLRLTHKQSLEVPRVVLHCAAAEPASNPYWALVARKLCSDRKLAKAFQFGAWGLFRRMGADGGADAESSDEDGLDDQDASSMPSVQATLNLARLYADLLSSQALPIFVLKHLDMASLAPASRARLFAEVLLVTAMLNINQRQSRKTGGTVDEQLGKLFGVDRVEGRLRLGLRWFLERVVAKSDLVEDARDRKVLQRCCGSVCSRLASAAGSDDEE